MAMTNGPLSDVVSSQYERWLYPEPILDLQAWLADNWQWFDPRHAHRLFWPDRAYQPEMDILVAGCGTNQAAVIAYTNPEAKVVAIDVSKPSLDHHQYLKDKYAMKNLELHLLPIEQVASLKLDFDLIISTGVIHHLAVPEEGVKALANCLRRDGVIALMLYAKYGRIGVEMLQGVFRELGLRQNDASVLMVKDSLARLDQDHPVKPYLAGAPDLRFDAGLVDTFLHGRDRSYTIDECFDLVESAGLVFQDLFLKSPYYPVGPSSMVFDAAVSALPARKQWSVMERVTSKNGCHFFMACRADRQMQRYQVDWCSEQSRDYVPSLRYRCSVQAGQLFRYDWTMRLDAVQLALMQQVDGCRTIAEIVALAEQSGVLPQLKEPELVKLGADIFRSLWQLDFIAIGLEAIADL